MKNNMAVLALIALIVLAFGIQAIKSKDQAVLAADDKHPNVERRIELPNGTLVHVININGERFLIVRNNSGSSISVTNMKPEFEEDK